MSKTREPYLCMAILFDLLLETRKPRKRVRDRNGVGGYKDNLSDPDVFCGLSRIVTGEKMEESKGDSLRKTVSDFKCCRARKSVYIPFRDPTTIAAFQMELNVNREKVYQRVIDFKDAYLNEAKCLWLISALIEVIHDDTGIQRDEYFEVSPGTRVKAQDLVKETTISFPVFLTDVLRYTLGNRSDSAPGEDTFHQWYKKEGPRSEWKFVGIIGGQNKNIDVTFDIPTRFSMKETDSEAEKEQGNINPDDYTIKVDSVDAGKTAVREHKKEFATTVEQASEEDILEARRFCIEYEKTIGLLPLCQIAFYVDPIHNNVRKMYSDYSLCKKSVRKEILRLKNVPEIPESGGWFRESFEKYEAEIKEKGLTERNYFYDGAKYFHRAYKNHSSEAVDLSNNPPIFERLIELNPKYFGFSSIPKDKCTLSDYIRDYMWEKEDHPDRKLTPPLDYLWNNLGLCAAKKESTVTEWICRFIIESSYWLGKKGYVIDERWGNIEVEDYLINTQEDLYFYALLRLYDVYMVERTDNLDEILSIEK